jgi:mitogen-activated protein kinase kinase kinase
MAMLASKTSFPAGMGSSSHTPVASQPAMPPPRRTPMMPSSGAYGSPTESEFTENDPAESVKNWDEDQVCEYLRSVKCGEYEKIFRKNHINGENLLEMDKDVLKEMGVEKVGDRVRLFLSIKKLRTRAYANEKKRNRVGYTIIHTYTDFVN